MIVRMSMMIMNKFITFMTTNVIIKTTIDIIQFYSQLSIIDLVESIYSSLDKTSRTFYWQRLQGDTSYSYLSSHIFPYDFHYFHFFSIMFQKAYEFAGEIYQFLEDFDQHMEEEESIFQPLLNQ